MKSIPISQEFITLAQALKVAGIAESGGQAKHLVREGLVTVNGAIERQPRKKLGAGDRLKAADTECIVVRESNPE